MFCNLPIWFSNFDFYYFIGIFVEKQLMFYPLTCASICKQRTFAMDFLDFVVLRSCKCRNYYAWLAEKGQYEKWLRQPLLVLFADKKWFDPPWGCYLINSATLAFITFDICKHPTLVDCNIWNFLEPSNSNFQ